MKNSLQILIFGFLIFSCGTIPKLKDGNLVKVERVGIMDTITVNVSGRVFDLHDKFGIESAEIELYNLENKYSEYCGKKGEFIFKHIPSGKYEINIYYPGYYSMKDTIELNSGEIVELKIGLGYDE